MVSLLSKLDAVNMMLAAIWESPVSSLDASGVGAVSAAERVLDQTSRSVQTRGWAFNTEYEYPLVMDVNGNIPLPLNTLQVDPSDPLVDYVQRGTQLYDRYNHTLIFTGQPSPVKVDITFLLDFEDMPQSARQYIAAFAARTFKARWLNQAEGQPTSEEIEALRNLEENEALSSDSNVLSDSYSVALTLRR